jgi:hypothetical protein
MFLYKYIHLKWNVYKKFPLIRVPIKVKLNSEYFTEHVLTPLLDVPVTVFYGRESHTAVGHDDQASSHPSQKTRRIRRWPYGQTRDNDHSQQRDTRQVTQHHLNWLLRVSMR